MFQCPACDNTTDFIVTHPVLMRLTHEEGSYHVDIARRDMAHGDLTADTVPWEDNDCCHCEACGHDDPVWAYVA